MPLPRLALFLAVVWGRTEVLSAYVVLLYAETESMVCLAGSGIIPALRLLCAARYSGSLGAYLGGSSRLPRWEGLGDAL